jgi:hypothetical protein
MSIHIPQPGRRARMWSDSCDRAAVPIVRERTVVVTRAPYLPPPVYRAPLPPYGYVAEIDYPALGW